VDSSPSEPPEKPGATRNYCQIALYRWQREQGTQQKKGSSARSPPLGLTNISGVWGNTVVKAVGKLAPSLTAKGANHFIPFRVQFGNSSWWHQASLVAQMVKNPPAMQETQVRSLGREDPLEKGMATHSNILFWRIPWTEEPGGPESMGLQTVRYNWSDLAWIHIKMSNAFPLTQWVHFLYIFKGQLVQIRLTHWGSGSEQTIGKQRSFNRKLV